MTPPGPCPFGSPELDGGGATFFLLTDVLPVETGVPGIEPSGSSFPSSGSIFFFPLPVPVPALPPRRFLGAVEDDAPGTSKAVEAVIVDMASSSAISSISINSSGTCPSSPGV